MSKEIYCDICKKGRMVLKQNKTNGNRFFGCTSFPYCTNTMSLRKYKHSVIGEVDEGGFWGDGELWDDWFEEF